MSRILSNYVLKIKQNTITHVINKTTGKTLSYEKHTHTVTKEKKEPLKLCHGTGEPVRQAWNMKSPTSCFKQAQSERLYT